MATYSNNFEGLWALAAHKISDFSLENHRFALGVSGGADSIALFHVFSSLFKKNKFSDLVVFHVNFGLRGEESDNDEAFVLSACAKESVACHVFKPGERIQPPIQQSARDFRLSVQEKFHNQGYKVVLAHNADDVTETILMRLARGASLENAAGMSYFDGNVLRPWLDVPREQIRHSLEEMGILWRDDSSNLKDIYVRNKIRLEVMPILKDLFPGAAARIARSFLTNPKSRQNINSSDVSVIALREFVALTKDVVESRLHGFFTAHYEGRSPIARQIIEQISAAILACAYGQDRQPRQFDLPHGKILRLIGGQLIIGPRN